MQVVRRNGEIWVCEKCSPDLQNGQPRLLGMSYDTLWSFYVPTSPCRCVFVRTFYHHFPIQITQIKKKSTSVTPTPEKTSDSAFSILVNSSQYKGEVRNSKFEKLIGLWAGKWMAVYARSSYIRVSDNNSRFDVARADDGNAEADPYMGARWPLYTP